MQLVGDRARARIGALEPAADARRAAEQLLHQLVPLDDERRAESEVWLAFTGRALVDPQQRAIHEQIHDELNRACTMAIETLVAAGRTAEGLDVALEAGRLHALLDGLALHAVMRPAKVSPSRIIAVIARHLDTLQASRSHGLEVAEPGGQP
jgi:BetI-type transcriptional repressor, C-terminal